MIVIIIIIIVVVYFILRKINTLVLTKAGYATYILYVATYVHMYK